MSATRKMRGTTNQENQEVSRNTWVGIGSSFSIEYYFTSAGTGTSSRSHENMAKTYNRENPWVSNNKYTGSSPPFTRSRH